jgi:hypothetical protein
MGFYVTKHAQERWEQRKRPSYRNTPEVAYAGASDVPKDLMPLIRIPDDDLWRQAVGWGAATYLINRRAGVVLVTRSYAADTYLITVLNLKTIERRRAAMNERRAKAQATRRRQ